MADPTAVLAKLRTLAPNSRCALVVDGSTYVLLETLKLDGEAKYAPYRAARAAVRRDGGPVRIPGWTFGKGRTTAMEMAGVVVADYYAHDGKLYAFVGN